MVACQPLLGPSSTEYACKKLFLVGGPGIHTENRPPVQPFFPVLHKEPPLGIPFPTSPWVPSIRPPSFWESFAFFRVRRRKKIARSPCFTRPSRRHPPARRSDIWDQFLLRRSRNRAPVETEVHHAAEEEDLDPAGEGNLALRSEPGGSSRKLRPGSGRKVTHGKQGQLRRSNSKNRRILGVSRSLTMIL